MKARIKATNELVEVNPSGTMRVSCGAYHTNDGRIIPATGLEFEKVIDWELRRYEIAKEMVSAMWIDDGQAERANTANGGIGFEYKTDGRIAKEAVQMADALIAELKKGGEK